MLRILHASIHSNNQLKGERILIFNQGCGPPLHVKGHTLYFCTKAGL
ncbi:hypothetical protein BRPE64_DCDS08100 (plasmid) [Caballeronia insecticola]|uniref:Uncharacterized protein n=1 Tax=Caballeronia insecticola TaxID=758793 RepID=R4X3X3_9BURK|nr:hypothetical protein BRPE64_DCDS08100 [Caballeronia insecticola]